MSHVNTQMAKQSVWLIEKFSNRTSSVRAHSVSVRMTYHCFHSFRILDSLSSVSVQFGTDLVIFIAPTPPLSPPFLSSLYSSPPYNKIS